MLASIKSRGIKGFVWAASESFGVALLSFISFAVMARTLEPRDFGIVALATVFIFFSNLFVAHSFADVVVQRQHIEPEHLDTAFWSTLGIAGLLAVLCNAVAGGVAVFLHEPEMAEVLCLLSLAVPLGAAGCVHMALCRREMRFGTLAVRSLLGRGIGAAAGIALALAGFGLWSLVAQQLAGTLVTTIATLATVRWRPRLRFSRRHLRDMWAFGMNVSATQIIAGISEQVLNLLVGTLFGSVALGYFTIAWRMTQLIRSLISSAVYHVGLSAFARLQDDRQALGRAFIQSTRIACLAGFPIATGIALVGEPLLLALFGQKWAPSVPLLTVLALEMIPIFYGIFFSALYRAANRAAWGLGMAAFNLALGVAGVLALAHIGIMAVAMFWVARALILVPIHVVLVRRILALPAAVVTGPILTPAIAALVMAVVLGPLRLALDGRGMGPWMELAIVVPIGVVLYGGVIRLASPELTRLALRTARLVRTPQGGTS